MKLADHNLKEILAALSPAERRSLEDALRGARTATASAILRKVRLALKRRARSRKETKHQWLM